MRRLAAGLRREQLQVPGGGGVEAQHLLLAPALHARHL